MENARLLDERLREIIGEVSSRTGGEIKKNLLADFEAGVNTALGQHWQREIIRLLSLIKSTIEKI
ncbi:MAG: hypothetical protein K6U74_05690 [Firmicutes bacterium]|nr:hypothetical protein [Bacillota bacterium]